MRCKTGLLAALLFAVSANATAQIEDSWLETVDPWGMGFLTADEPSLPTDMWQGTRADALLPLMQTVRTHDLTPAERTLVRRMALSPANAPAGENDAALRAERARIVFELGEATAAAELMSHLEEAPPEMDAEVITADLNLALGNEATACAMLDDETRQGPYWSELRAVCAALEDNATGAELAIEIARAEGGADSWLLSAVFAAAGGLEDPPMARFDSGIALAISAKAGLAIPDDAVPLERPDLAAAMATRPDLPARLKAEAAAVAARAGLLAPEVYRETVEAVLAEEGEAPTNAVERAVDILKTHRLPTQTGREHLSAALDAALGDPAHFRMTARALKAEIASAPLFAASAPDAALFAKANIAAGNLKSAARWVIAGHMGPDDTHAQHDLAMTAATLVLAGTGKDLAISDSVAIRLVEASETPAQQTAAARMFALWAAAGVLPPPRARTIMAEHGAPSTSLLSPTAVLAVRSAARAGGAGEVVIAMVGLTDGTPQDLGASDLAHFYTALTEIGIEDDGRLLLLEASRYWDEPALP